MQCLIGYKDPSIAFDGAEEVTLMSDAALIASMSNGLF